MPEPLDYALPSTTNRLARRWYNAFGIELAGGLRVAVAVNAESVPQVCALLRERDITPLLIASDESANAGQVSPLNEWISKIRTANRDPILNEPLHYLAEHSEKIDLLQPMQSDDLYREWAPPPGAMIFIDGVVQLIQAFEATPIMMIARVYHLGLLAGISQMIYLMMIPFQITNYKPLFTVIEFIYPIVFMTIPGVCQIIFSMRLSYGDRWCVKWIAIVSAIPLVTSIGAIKYLHQTKSDGPTSLGIFLMLAHLIINILLIIQASRTAMNHKPHESFP